MGRFHVLPFGFPTKMALMTAFGVVYITQTHETQSAEINLLLLVSKGVRFTSCNAFALKMCWHSILHTHVMDMNGMHSVLWKQNSHDWSLFDTTITWPLKEHTADGLHIFIYVYSTFFSKAIYQTKMNRKEQKMSYNFRVILRVMFLWNKILQPWI